MRRLLFLVVCFVQAIASSAKADDVAEAARDVLQRNGYDGVWSMDCVRSPSENIPRINWVLPDRGPVQQWVDVGRGYFLEGIVSSASVGQDGKVILSVRSLSGLFWKRTTMPVGNKIRMIELAHTWRGRTTVQVRNGHDLRTDLDTPTIEKCGDGAALTS